MISPLSPPGSAHALTITCAEWYGIVEGFGDGTFRPGREVTRGQSATFVANLLDASGLDRPLNQPGSFSDTLGDTHEDNIEWLVGLGIVGGFHRPQFRSGPTGHTWPDGHHPRQRLRGHHPQCPGRG